ncbi:cation:proton antiporter [Naumannella halotolerans]|uniref:cation:proton antiporter n=1 Tax=Naumannella halotolerans TaxID=993414 RepID=UPI00370D6F5C
MILAIAALAAIVIAALLSRRTGVAAPLLLLVIGIGISLIPSTPNFELEPEWILAGVLPPLLYASAVRVPVRDLRRNFRMIGLLSVTLVIVSAFVIGGVISWLMPTIPFWAAVALGAVVSPTDAVAATSIGKRLGLPHRLMTVLEGESLLNDASALVLLRTATVALAGSFSIWSASWEFLRAVVIAVVVGLLVGWLTVHLRARLADPVLTTAVSFIVPFLAYLPAEQAEASGVVSVVVAGLVTGNMSVRKLSARERSTERTNWNTLQFLIENGVFLLMGLEISTLLADLQDNGHTAWTVLGLAGLVIVLLLVLRAAFIGVEVLGQRRAAARFPAARERVNRIGAKLDAYDPEDERIQQRIDRYSRRLARGRADLDFYEREPIGLRGAVVLSWAGMRGVVTLAAALTLPLSTTDRSLLIGVAFAVAVISLLLYGGTLPLVIRWAKVRTPDVDEQRDEVISLMESLGETAENSLASQKDVTIDGHHIDSDVVDSVLDRFRQLRDRRRPADDPDQLTKRQQQKMVSRTYLEAMQEALHEERAIGAYSTYALQRAQSYLDAEELRQDR